MKTKTFVLPVLEKIIFEDPPPDGRGGATGARKHSIRAWLDMLRSYPGHWSRFDGLLSSGGETGAIRKGGYGTEPGEFDVCCRKVDGGFSLYAKYVPKA